MDRLGERLAQGDTEAFAELYDACAGRCHHYLVVRLGSRDAADDVLQETFFRLVRHGRRLAQVDDLISYVFIVARNEAVRYARRTWKAAELHATLSAEDLFLEAVGQDVARRDLAEAVSAGLGRLSADQREAVELKIYGGLTFREIAEVTGVPLPTAATRYRTALEELRGWLARQLT
jgi:RNA polymerase sigma-70 factor (ECF subfamily)